MGRSRMILLAALVCALALLAVPAAAQPLPASLWYAQFRTNVPDGTLAMRNAPTDEFPFMQIGHNLTGTVIAGPVCHGGYRVWRVALTQNGQAVEGWLNEGTPQRYFLDPLP